MNLLTIPGRFYLRVAVTVNSHPQSCVSVCVRLGVCVCAGGEGSQNPLLKTSRDSSRFRMPASTMSAENQMFCKPSSRRPQPNQTAPTTSAQTPSGEPCGHCGWSVRQCLSTPRGSVLVSPGAWCSSYTSAAHAPAPPQKHRPPLASFFFVFKIF